MPRFVRRIPNGNYVVKLHFAVTYEVIDGSRQCVFSFDVEGRAFKDFDLFVRAGGALKAYVESIPGGDQGWRSRNQVHGSGRKSHHQRHRDYPPTLKP